MEDRDPALDDSTLAAELFERSDIVAELDAAQIEGWVSGLFAAWESDDEAAAFVEYCTTRTGATAAALLAGLAYLADGEVQRTARNGFDRMASHAPDGAAGIASASPAQAWTVQAPFGRSLVIGFRQGGDDVDHTVLVELDEEAVLVDLALSGPSHELLDPENVDSRTFQVVDVEASKAMQTLATAWDSALRAGIEPSVAVLANQRLVRRRLLDHGLDVAGWFEINEAAIDFSRGMEPDEIQRADAAALNTLRAAVGDSPERAPDPAWVAVIRGRVPGLSPREREGLLWLEWADWLGAGIGLIRTTGDIEATPGLFVDLVNRCPEVSSTIHADDREYAEWAFGLAIEHLVDQGALGGSDAGAAGLGDDQRSALHASLVAAWQPVA